MHLHDDAVPPGFMSPQELLREENTLVIQRFDERISYEMGCEVADRAIALGLPLSISIRVEDRETFRVMLPGSPPIGTVVLDAKYRTAARGGHSSLYERNLRIARLTTFEEETGLAFPDHAPFGGAVPVRSSASGEIRGWVVITGLSQEEDHAIAVGAIRNVIARTKSASPA